MSGGSAFDVISHGDCWVNNLMFRYDAQSQPVEVMLVDFQLCRKSSLGVDLNYFLFSSLTAAERNVRLTDLLATYYTAFQEVTEAAGIAAPYTLDDVIGEFHKKNIVGLIFGALAIPALVCDPQDAQEFDVTSDDHTNNYVTKKRQNTLNMLKTNSLVLPRLMNLYDDVELYAGLT